MFCFFSPLCVVWCGVAWCGVFLAKMTTPPTPPRLWLKPDKLFFLLDDDEPGLHTALDDIEEGRLASDLSSKGNSGLNFGVTLLHLACLKPSHAAVRRLLDFNVIACRRKVAESESEEERRKREQLRVDVNVADIMQQTPFLLACLAGDRDLVSIFLSYHSLTKHAPGSPSPRLLSHFFFFHNLPFNKRSIHGDIL